MTDDRDTRDMAIRSEAKLVEINKEITGLKATLSDVSAKLDRLLLEREIERAERKGQLKVIGLVSSIFGAVFGTLTPYLLAWVKAWVFGVH